MINNRNTTLTQPPTCPINRGHLSSEDRWVLVPWIVVVHLPRLCCVCRGPVDLRVSWTRGRSGLVGMLTLSDRAPHHLEPEGQSAVMAGALSLDRSAGGVYGVMRSRSFCGVQRGERGC